MKLLETVALLHDVPEQSLERGAVGTVVEELDEGVVLVEFSGLDGVAYAIAPVPTEQLLPLRHAPIK